MAETQGNPLALLELPRGLTPAELAGGFGLPGPRPLEGRIEESFRRQLDALPPEARRLLQLAAADPSGDPVLVRRAAGRLGFPFQAAAPAVKAGLVDFGVGVRFRHPLLRSAAYRSASAADRQAMHSALAEVTDPKVDPDRRAWHRAQATPVTYAHWAAAILANGLGRYADALIAARQASQDTPALYMAMWALPELIEAVVRTGNTPLAAGALARLTETTQAGQTDFGLGIEARSRALVSEGAVAEGCYREAIDRLGRTQLRPELARAHLLYGEWLRREGRRTDARVQLRTAHEMLAAMGTGAFAERARRELLATGETVRKRTLETGYELTAQEASIARLARDGRTNPEIGAQLFLSARTVEWHLRKVFTKLGISSRRELPGALADLGPGGLPA